MKSLQVQLDSKVIEGFLPIATAIKKSTKPVLMLYNGKDYQLMLDLLAHFAIPTHIGTGTIEERHQPGTVLIQFCSTEWTFALNQEFVMSAIEQTKTAYYFCTDPSVIFRDKVTGQEFLRLHKLGVEILPAAPGARAVEPNSVYRLVHVWYGEDGQKHEKQALYPDGNPVYFGTDVPAFTAYAKGAMATVLIDKRLKVSETKLVKAGGILGLLGGFKPQTTVSVVMTEFSILKTFV